MAEMYPAELPPEVNDTERDIYHLFKSLPAQFCGWNDKDLGIIRPDFILYTPKNGLIVFEVKAWELKQIVGGHKYKTTIKIGHKYETRTSPFGQAQSYFDELKDIMSDGNGFILPLHMGIILPNITRNDYLKREKDPRDGISKVTDASRTIFKDDLEKIRISKDKGKEFQELLDRQFFPRFKMEHTPELLKAVQSRLSTKKNKITLPAPRFDDKKVVLELDEDQAKIASNLNKNCLLAGPAGSGKTVVLARRASILRERGYKRILFLCFNLSLVNYIRRILAGNCVPLLPTFSPKHSQAESLLEDSGVMVMPIFDLIACLNGKIAENASTQKDFNDEAEVAALLLQEEDCPYRGTWDAILVDEGQDFTPAMTAIVRNLLKPEGSLLVAMDQAQELYSWSSPELWNELEVRKISRRYRCTQHIMAFAEDWLAKGEFQPLDKLGRSHKGTMPIVHKAKNEGEAARMAADDIHLCIQGSLDQGSCAALYVKAGTLPQLLEKELGQKGIMSVTATESEESKRRYDITLDSVTISTVHSMKGMDFTHVVLLLPLSFSEGRHDRMLASPDEKTRANSWAKSQALNLPESPLRSTIYVGMTRARQSLTVIWYDDKA